ncbi:hypothetical protein COCSADRAFT_41592 [Bipolaris sorokiniana ND90Pr]|uniref:RNase III domain-containing protein n=1 Tax=Cochliobolus sativus (strain ND90Pr / ATCC 201652) TaxID=665912 RepID=M2S904_COCSN|nr:uncharacterized protein COCSADRAFT_41592 [Bipolaris sorokiniana ND90Pr]EMD59040.1 hypothetical protein COCSADRAFT_41592 [Bipolaris sorokiniana ND90Pr]
MAAGPPEYITSLQNDLDYHFANIRLLVEALRAPGAGCNTQNNFQDPDGYRRLSQLGESVIHLVIADEGYIKGHQRATVSFESQSVTQRALTCANRINLSECISTNLSQQGTPPSIKMITQSMMALCAAIYIDCGRDIIRLKSALHHIDFIENVDYTNADMENCS